MIGYPHGCKCYLEYEQKPDGSFDHFLNTGDPRSERGTIPCQFHAPLGVTPALWAALKAEGKLWSSAFWVIHPLDPTATIYYSFDASRKLSLQVTSVLSKSAIQTAIDTAVGSGKVTVA